MTEEQQARKLELIARQQADELLGWEFGIAAIGRDYFPGEKAAILKRKKELGIK